MRRIVKILAWAVFHFAAALSLLACLGAVALWARSAGKADHFWLIHRSGHAQMLRSASGDIEFKAKRTYYADTSRRPRLQYEHSVGEPGVSEPSQSYRLHGRVGPVRWGRSQPRPAPTAEELRQRGERFDALLARLRELDRRAQAGDRQAAGEWVDTHLVVQGLHVFQGPQWSVHAPAWLVTTVAAALPGLWVYRMSRRRHPPGHCSRCGYDLRGGGGRCPECGTPVGETVVAT